MARLRLRPHPAIAFPCLRPPTLRLRMRARRVGIDGAIAAAAAMTRQSCPIMAYTGENGGGKTAAAIYDLLPTLAGIRWHCDDPKHYHPHRQHCSYRTSLGARVCDCPLDGPTTGLRTVLSTCRLRDLEDADHPLWVPFDSFTRLLYFEHGEVLMDEVTGVADARDHQGLPVQVRNLIYQLRRRDVRLLWTTVDYSAADNRLRTATQMVTYCRGGADVAHLSPGRMWRQRRLLRWTTFDAMAFDLFTTGKREKLKPEALQWVWRPGHALDTAYNTEAPVLQVGVATTGGMCLSCGGSRSTPRCACPPDPELLPEGVIEEQRGATRVRTVVA